MVLTLNEWVVENHFETLREQIECHCQQYTEHATQLTRLCMISIRQDMEIRDYKLKAAETALNRVAVGLDKGVATVPGSLADEQVHVALDVIRRPYL